jgi:hypothetical protein
VLLAFSFVGGDKLKVLDEKFQNEVKKIEADLDGVLGYAIKDLKTQKTYFPNEKEIFPRAS